MFAASIGILGRRPLIPLVHRTASPLRTAQSRSAVGRPSSGTALRREAPARRCSLRHFTVAMSESAPRELIAADPAYAIDASALSQVLKGPAPEQLMARVLVSRRCFDAAGASEPAEEPLPDQPADQNDDEEPEYALLFGERRPLREFQYIGSFNNDSGLVALVDPAAVPPAPEASPPALPTPNQLPPPPAPRAGTSAAQAQAQSSASASGSTWERFVSMTLDDPEARRFPSDFPQFLFVAKLAGGDVGASLYGCRAGGAAAGPFDSLLLCPGTRRRLFK
eukprot:tig00020629_g12337.t1